MTDQASYDQWLGELGTDGTDGHYDYKAAFAAQPTTARGRKIKAVLPDRFMTPQHPQYGGLGQAGSSGFLQQTQNTVGGSLAGRTMAVPPADAVARAVLNVGKGVAKDLGAPPVKTSAFDVSMPQTEFQKRDQAAFDSRFDSSGHFRATATGGQKFIPFPTSTPGDGKPTIAPTGRPTDILAGIPESAMPDASLTANAKPTFGGKTLDYSLDSGAPALAPTPVAPSGARLAGRAIGGGIDAVRGAVKTLANDVTATYAPPLQAAAASVGEFAGGIKESVGAGVGAGVNSVKDFAGGLSEGRTTAAGVSNSQAAQFQQPTAANPAPITPTSPVADVNKTPESIARFGQTDADWKRQGKTLLAGF